MTKAVEGRPVASKVRPDLWRSGGPRTEHDGAKRSVRFCDKGDT